MKTMLTEKETATIEDILMEQLEVKRDQIKPESRIKDDLSADSLDIAEIVMKLEDEFGITIPDESAEAVESVEDIHETLTKLLGR